MINRYSLSDYILTIDIGPEKISIGGPGEQGEGSFVGQFSFARANNAWSTTGDATGSWVHEQNLDKSGTATLQIRQISDDVLKLIYLSNLYDPGEAGSSVRRNAMTLTLTNATTHEAVAKCISCYLQKVPDQNFGGQTEVQNWVWTCGRINFEGAKTLQ